MSYFNKKAYNHTQKNDSNTKKNDSNTKKNNSHRSSGNNSYISNQNLKDYGPSPFIVDIEKITKGNDNFRTTLWTGEHLQVALMSIEPGQDIGAEVHNNLDQFIRIEQGKGVVMMGDSKDKVTLKQPVFDDYVIIIPAGKWHNLINIGSTPLKLYSIYAPPEHPYGTVHQTKAIAKEYDDHH